MEKLRSIPIVFGRLPLCALANHYGRDAVCSGPASEQIEELPGALGLRFKHPDGGLVVKGDKLGDFSVAGAEGKWFWTCAKIAGGCAVVSSSECNVRTPLILRGNPIRRRPGSMVQEFRQFSFDQASSKFNNL